MKLIVQLAAEDELVVDFLPLVRKTHISEQYMITSTILLGNRNSHLSEFVKNLQLIVLPVHTRGGLGHHEDSVT